MLACTACGRELGDDARVVSMSGSIQGDECTETWYLCPHCRVYSVEVYWDIFLGEDVVSARGPVDRAEGDEEVQEAHGVFFSLSYR